MILAEEIVTEDAEPIKSAPQTPMQRHNPRCTKWLDPYQFFTTKDVAECTNPTFDERYNSITTQSYKFKKFYQQLMNTEAKDADLQSEMHFLVKWFLFENYGSERQKDILKCEREKFEKLKRKYAIVEGEPKSQEDKTLNRIAGARPDILGYLLGKYPNCVIGHRGRLPAQLAFLMAPALIPRTEEWSYTMMLWRSWRRSQDAVLGVNYGSEPTDFGTHILHRLGFQYTSELERHHVMHKLGIRPIGREFPVSRGVSCASSVPSLLAPKAKHFRRNSM